jgi:hypothetical protein
VHIKTASKIVVRKTSIRFHEILYTEHLYKELSIVKVVKLTTGPVCSLVGGSKKLSRMFIPGMLGFWVLQPEG